jgi:hypothetical protein
MNSTMELVDGAAVPGAAAAVVVVLCRGVGVGRGPRDGVLVEMERGEGARVGVVVPDDMAGGVRVKAGVDVPGAAAAAAGEST